MDDAREGRMECKDFHPHLGSNKGPSLCSGGVEDHEGNADISPPLVVIRCLPTPH